MDSSAALNRVALRWHRIRGGWRCVVGLHRLKAYHDLGDGVSVQPMKGRALPQSKHDFRKCEWCGARWRSKLVPIRQAHRLGMAYRWRRVY